MGLLLKVSEAASLHRRKWKIGGMACPAQFSDTLSEGVKETRLTAQLAKLYRSASNSVQVYMHAGCFNTYRLPLGRHVHMCRTHVCNANALTLATVLAQSLVKLSGASTAAVVPGQSKTPAQWAPV